MLDRSKKASRRQAPFLLFAYQNVTAILGTSCISVDAPDLFSVSIFAVFPDLAAVWDGPVPPSLAPCPSDSGTRLLRLLPGFIGSHISG